MVYYLIDDIYSNHNFDQFLSEKKNKPIISFFGSKDWKGMRHFCSDHRNTQSPTWKDQC